MTATVPNAWSASRRTADAYFTPPALALAICQRLRWAIGEVDLVIEPSAGDGAFVRAARQTWGETPAIVAVEPNCASPTVLHSAGADIVVGRAWESPEADLHIGPLLAAVDSRTLIVGNPPFRHAEEHVRLALHRLAQAGRPSFLAFLLRQSFLGSQHRIRGLWREVPPRYVWHVAPRPSFTADTRTDGSEYAVMVWLAGYRGGYEGGWLDWAGPC